jgi:hypothetical protein
MYFMTPKLNRLYIQINYCKENFSCIIITPMSLIQFGEIKSGAVFWSEMHALMRCVLKT